MYLFHYYIDYFRKCFKDTYKKENGINHKKTDYHHWQSVFLYLLTKMSINPTPNKQSYKPN